MQVCSNFKRMCSRLGGLVGGGRKKQPRRALTISAPFDFKKETTMLPGFTEDEISVLREKAAASRIGVADHGQDHYGHPRASASPSSSSAGFLGPISSSSPRPAPPIPTRAAGHSLKAPSAGATLSVGSKPSVSPVSPLDVNFGPRPPVSPMSVKGQGRPF